MNIDIEKIEEIYGKELLYEIKDNSEEVIENLSYLTKYHIDNIYEILECFPYIFLDDIHIFQQKIDEFIKRLGPDYKEKLELNMELWGEIE